MVVEGIGILGDWHMDVAVIYLISLLHTSQNYNGKSQRKLPAVWANVSSITIRLNQAGTWCCGFS